MYSTAVLKIDSASKIRANWLKISRNSAIFSQNSTNFCQFTHTNFNLFHYSGNNPVRYTDPTGAFDWETNTITPNDTLSQITEDYNKQNGTNFTVKDVADANGIDNPDLIYAGNTLDFSSLEKTPSLQADVPNTTANHNVRDGSLEILSGVIVWLLGGVAVYNIMKKEPEKTATVGHDALVAGTLLIADGLGRVEGLKNDPIKDDLLSVLESPLASLTKEFNDLENPNGKGRNPGRTKQFPKQSKN